MLMLIIATSYFPRMIQLIVREVIEITPRPDSIPFNPASILVKLEQIETAIGIKSIYKRPTLGGAIHHNGIPAKKSKNNFSLDDNTIKSSTIPTIPTSKTTTRTTTNWNVNVGKRIIPTKIPIIKPNSIPIPPISATIGREDLWISFPMISAFSSLRISHGMTNRVLINDKIPQINAITTKGNVGIEIKLDIFTPKIFSLDNLYFF